MLCDFSEFETAAMERFDMLRGWLADTDFDSVSAGPWTLVDAGDAYYLYHGDTRVLVVQK